MLFWRFVICWTEPSKPPLPVTPKSPSALTKRSMFGDGFTEYSPHVEAQKKGEKTAAVRRCHPVNYIPISRQASMTYHPWFFPFPFSETVVAIGDPHLLVCDALCLDCCCLSILLTMSLFARRGRQSALCWRRMVSSRKGKLCAPRISPLPAPSI